MKMKSVVIVAASLAAVLQVANAADITGKITLKGTPPPEREITDMAGNADCSKLHTAPVKTQHYVVVANGELANVVVSLKGLSGKSTGESATPAVLDQKGCEYVPQIFAIQTNQKLIVKNSDPVLHNIHTTPLSTSGNKEENKPQTAQGPDLSFVFSKPEPFLRFKCDVHQWMYAWVTVFDHPYFAVSGKDGTFKIANVPPGKYTLEAAHRKAAPNGETKEIEVKDQGVTVDFTLEAK